MSELKDPMGNVWVVANFLSALGEIGFDPYDVTFPPPYIMEMVNKLVERYSNRKYHNFRHIQYCLNFLEGMKINDPWMKFAIIMHDLEDTEEDSIKASTRFLLQNLNGENKKLSPEHTLEIKRNVWRVGVMIMATRCDVPWREYTEEEAIVASIDRAILGEERAIYKIYCDDIKEEYRLCALAESLSIRGQTFEDYWKEGRCAFLNSMLSRECIFPYLPIREKLEAQAVENMKWDLAQYES